MSALEPIEAGAEPRLRAAERRKVGGVLDLVMSQHSRDEAAQPWSGDRGEPRRRRAVLKVVVGGELEPGGLAAQLLVHLEPERDARRARRAPGRTRMTFEQELDGQGTFVVGAQSGPAAGPKRAQAIEAQTTTTSTRVNMTAAEPKSFA